MLSTANEFPRFYFVFTRCIDAGKKYFDFDEAWFTNKFFWVSDCEFKIKIKKLKIQIA